MGGTEVSGDEGEGRACGTSGSGAASAVLVFFFLELVGGSCAFFSWLLEEKKESQLCPTSPLSACVGSTRAVVYFSPIPALCWSCCLKPLTRPCVTRPALHGPVLPHPGGLRSARGEGVVLVRAHVWPAGALGLSHRVLAGVPAVAGRRVAGTLRVAFASLVVDCEGSLLAVWAPAACAAVKEYEYHELERGAVTQFFHACFFYHRFHPISPVFFSFLFSFR